MQSSLCIRCATSLQIRQILLCSDHTDKCPAFVNESANRAAGAGETTHRRRLEYAQLLQDNVPAAPIYSGLDGGMNPAFLAQFPGRVTLSKVLPWGGPYFPQLP